MNLVSARVITDDLPRLVAFYEHLTGQDAAWATPAFAEIDTAGGTLALADVSTVALFGEDSARPGDNRSVIIEFLVDDVDADHARLARLDGVLDDLVQPPTTMPWGNRSLLLRDPDGTLVNLFTPVTAAAREKTGVDGRPS